MNYTLDNIYTLLPIIQLPIFIIMVTSIKLMSGCPVFLISDLEPSYPYGFDSGGILWFCNLTIPDSTRILPLFILTIQLLNIEVILCKILFL